MPGPPAARQAEGPRHGGQADATFNPTAEAISIALTAALSEITRWAWKDNEGDKALLAHWLLGS
jgi:hypothetical protein